MLNKLTTLIDFILLLYLFIIMSQIQSQEDESSKRLSSILASLTHDTNNIYISGIGGTGKSYLLSQVYDHLRERKEKAILTSTTGVSAFNIKGRTIHSWTGLILPAQIPDDVDKFLKKMCDKVALSAKYRARWKSVKYLLIDEISMLGANYIEVMDTIAKYVRKNNLPMGGIKLICSGDMLQLPPVNDDFCFKSPVWKELNFQYFVLTKAFRFTDQYWVDVLTRVRIGEMTEDDIKLFATCHEKYKEFQKNANKNCYTSINPTIVYSLRKDVENINSQSVKQLVSEEFEFEALDEYYFKEQDQVKYMCSEKQSQFLDQNTNIPRKISLKKGAQVMLTVNLDVQNGLVNGSRGVVIGFTEKDKLTGKQYPLVEFVSTSQNPDQPFTQIVTYNFEVEEDNSILKRSAIPLELAFATTTHKVQGSSLDFAQIDCGNSIFEAGQGYVALSRCRSIKGLFISAFNPKRVYPDKDALKFEKEMMSKAIKLE